MLDLQLQPFPALETTRLQLRRITEADAGEMLKLRSDERIMQYIDRPRLKNIEEALEHIRKISDAEENNNGVAWAISLKPDKTMIGFIGFWNIDKENYRGEIGYMLQPEFQRTGIMHEALSAVLKFGFQSLHFHTVKANVNPENNASIKLLEKNHFVREAYFRQDYFYNNRFLDSAIYCLLNSDS